MSYAVCDCAVCVHVLCCVCYALCVCVMLCVVLCVLFCVCVVLRVCCAVCVVLCVLLCVCCDVHTLHTYVNACINRVYIITLCVHTKCFPL